MKVVVFYPWFPKSFTPLLVLTTSTHKKNETNKNQIPKILHHYEPVPSPSLLHKSNTIIYNDKRQTNINFWHWDKHRAFLVDTFNLNSKNTRFVFGLHLIHIVLHLKEHCKFAMCHHMCTMQDGWRVERKHFMVMMFYHS